MDRETFHREIIEIAKKREPLSEERMNRVTERVFDHIDATYGVDEQAVNEPRPLGLFGRIKASLTRENGNNLARPFAFTFAALSVLVVGSLLFKATTTTHQSLEIPVTLADTGLHRYVDIPVEGGRAFVSVEKSAERLAFLAGMVQADLDIMDDNDAQLSADLVDWYYREAGIQETTVQAGEFDQLVEKYDRDDISGDWFKEGYAVELLQVSAKRSVESADQKPAMEALKYYQNLTSKLKNIDYQGKYKTHRDSLIDLTPSKIADSADLKRISRIAYEMKLYNQ